MKAGERAISQCEIEDVFLVASECRVNRELNQSQVIAEVICQNRVMLDSTVITQTRTPIDTSNPDVHILRYFVTGEFRILVNIEMERADEVPDADVFAKIKLTFAADYQCPKAFSEDKEAIAAFGKNVAFHVWPYWREGVHECAARMRLPRVTVPMMKPKIPTAPESAAAHSDPPGNNQ